MSTQTVKKPVKKATTNKVTEGASDASPLSCLVDKKIRLKLIPNNRSKITNNISESTAFTHTSRSIILPKEGRTGRYINPLNNEELDYLQSRLEVNLDPSKEKDNYWDKIRVTLRKDDPELDKNYVELDLSDPHMYLMYKVLLAAPEVANSATEDFLPHQVFFIEDNEVDDTRRYNMEEDLDRAGEFKVKLKGNRVGLFNFLRVYSMSNKNVKVSRSDTVEFMYSKLGTLIRDPRTLRKVLSLIDTKESDEAAYNINLMVLDGIEIGEITNTSSGFQAANGTYLGSDLNEAITFFKNPANVSLKNRIRKQIDLQLN